MKEVTDYTKRIEELEKSVKWWKIAAKGVMKVGEGNEEYTQRLEKHIEELEKNQKDWDVVEKAHLSTISRLKAKLADARDDGSIGNAYNIRQRERRRCAEMIDRLKAELAEAKEKKARLPLEIENDIALKERHRCVEVIHQQLSDACVPSDTLPGASLMVYWNNIESILDAFKGEE